MDFSSGVCNLWCCATDCFKGIQLAREFESQFTTYQLKLDIVQLRLSRWVEATGITGSHGGTQGQHQDDPTIGTNVNRHRELFKHAEGILQRIQTKVKTAQEEAEAMKPSLPPSDDQALDPESNISSTELKNVRKRFHECVSKRRCQLKRAKDSLKWAFYKKHNFETFIVAISKLVTELEDLLPQDDKNKLRKLSEQECEGFNQVDFSKANLSRLALIAADCDPWLKGTIEEILQRLYPSGISVTQSENHNSMVTGIHNGHIKGAIIGTNHQITQQWGEQ